MIHGEFRTNEVGYDGAMSYVTRHADPLTIQVDPREFSVWLVSPGAREANLYRLDQLDRFPEFSDRDRALALGMLDAVVAKLRAQAG